MFNPNSQELIQAWNAGKVKLVGYRLLKPSLEIVFLFEEIAPKDFAWFKVSATPT